jgi:hypothetical protein
MKTLILSRLESLQRKHAFYSAYTLIAILAVAIMALVQAQPVRAVTCAYYHTIKNTDTTTIIAKTYDLKWRVIADTNGLEYPYELFVGERLCIPPKGAVVSTTTLEDGVLNITVVGDRITIYTSKFTDRYFFNARIRSGTAYIGGWYKLGMVRVNKKTEQKFTFTLTSKLKSERYFTVCLKETSTDDMICRTVVHQ